MDHKISKDMISSGLTPSGEKTQADLGRTQYGSAPSPSSLMEAYRSMYEHHKKDADGNTIPHEDEEINEGNRGTMDMSKSHPEALKKVEKKIEDYAKKNPRVPGGKMGVKKETKEENVDLFDLVKGKLIDEGCDEQEAIKIMVNLSEEDLNELLGKAALVTGGLVAGKMALDAGKKRFNKFLNKQRNQSPIGGNKRVDDVRAGSGDPTAGKKINY